MSTKIPSHTVPSVYIVLLFHVLDEGVLLQELAGTEAAFVHLLPSVDPTVLLVHVGPHELLAAELALERLIPSMYYTMLPQIATEGEALSAFRALVRFLVRRVSAQMLVKQALGREHFVANLAVQLLRRVVHDFVCGGAAVLFRD